MRVAVAVAVAVAPVVSVRLLLREIGAMGRADRRDGVRRVLVVIIPAFRPRRPVRRRVIVVPRELGRGRRAPGIRG